MATERFEEHRDLLTGVAYRILGSVADAEDVVQDAWLRWSGVDAAEVEDDRAYLIRVTTRLSIDLVGDSVAAPGLLSEVSSHSALIAARAARGPR